MSRKEKIEKHTGGALPGGIVTGGKVHGGTVTGRCSCGGSYLFTTDAIGRSIERCSRCDRTQSLGDTRPPRSIIRECS